MDSFGNALVFPNLGFLIPRKSISPHSSLSLDVKYVLDLFLLGAQYAVPKGIAFPAITGWVDIIRNRQLPVGPGQWIKPAY